MTTMDPVRRTRISGRPTRSSISGSQGTYANQNNHHQQKLTDFHADLKRNS